MTPHADALRAERPEAPPVRRAFRGYAGMSPHTWITQMRVQRAEGLLEAGALTIAQIAFACGFSSQSHLTETFRRTNGLPPALWQKRMRGRLRAGDGI
ncbi:MAG: helix-turn-helix domain-containing protein [Labrys sp. (in: a-proteobacteria)]|jgi:AraC family transcriptional regulator